MQLAERDMFKYELERYEENSKQKQLSPKVKTGIETSTNKENMAVKEQGIQKEVRLLMKCQLCQLEKSEIIEFTLPPTAQKPLFQDPYNQAAKNSHLTINQEQVLKDPNQDYQAEAILDSQDKLPESNAQESLASIQRAFRELDKEKGKTLI